ncbi:MAG: hypothetical protein GDA56_14700 [Hormoscilla sp. GM7CHS1pb]|nr:hypothetical protein [Hormoscilla sp. GM7CHS1pb]
MLICAIRLASTTGENRVGDVKTPEKFRKELAVGLLTYNLICALIVKGAIVAYPHNS